MIDKTATSEVYCPACARFILEGQFEMFRFRCRCGVDVWAHRVGGVVNLKAVPRLTRGVKSR